MSSAAVVIGALRVKIIIINYSQRFMLMVCIGNRKNKTSYDTYDDMQS